MSLTIRQSGIYRFVEEGNGPPLVLLHGLFGALSNWQPVLEHFTRHYRVSIPLMPVYSGEPVCRTVDELASFVEGFIESRGYSSVSLVGNSLGGHVALLLTLKRPELVNTLTLTASSGLFEEGMGQGFIKRGDYSFIQERVAYTFYDPATATKELVDEVFGLVNDRMAAMRTLNLARDAQRENLRERLRKITCPVLLVWGLNDNITPTYVAHEFRKLIPRAEVRFIDHCGHAPMMEQPARFNHLLQRFLEKQLTPEITRQAA